ncbi:hypothetical protein B0H14DRAFT_3618159 [Mycena olivaceomarginata]|nr:hypothetical protein B0H14DRAFT_3618159 [Mycena olivaceomarginata]
MSGSGITYYNEELKMLLHLLKALPDTIPEGDLHDFRHYVLDPIKMKDIGCAKTVLSAKLKSSFGYRVDQDLRDSMPSYAKVGTSLFQVLAKELQAGRAAPAFARYSSAADIMAAYKSQFELYTRQHPPFSVRSQHWFKPMQYWRALSEQPESSILAFVAIKIFSILGNSMPEERTVSRFTCINSKDRANQDASTIVNQTKIYQHLRREARAAGKLPEQNSKLPSLKWRTVKSLFAPVRGANPAPGASSAPIVVSDTEKAEAPRVSLTPEHFQFLSLCF